MNETIVVENPNGEPSIGIVDRVTIEMGTPPEIKVLEPDSKIIRIICLLDLVLNILNGSPYYIVSMMFNIMGYVGIVKTFILYIKIYVSYLFLNTCAKIYMLFELVNKVSLLIYVLITISTVLQFAFFIYNFKYLRYLSAQRIT
jgi:hypothetical protein